MRLRRLNDDGMQALHQWLDSLETTPTESAQFDPIEDSALSEPVEPEVHVERRGFGSRMELASYLHDALAPIAGQDVILDPGIWSWLAAFWFDELCPRDRAGLLKPRERARWVPAMSDWRKYYRHLVAGPYSIYAAHRDEPQCALAVLANPVDRPGDVYEQLASRQDLATSAPVMEVATRLYADPETMQLKYGSGTKGPGGPRRLAEGLLQFDLSWDLRSMNADGLLSMLPTEFDRFKGAD